MSVCLIKFKEDLNRSSFLFVNECYNKVENIIRNGEKFNE
jgi:hypothetical protein